jgi:hypothetical protein
MNTSSTVFDATAIAALVTFLVSTLKPFVETLPFARPSSATHDATLRLLNVLLNVGLVLVTTANAGTLSSTNWLAYALQALAQAAGSQLLYHTTTRSGGSIGGTPSAAVLIAPGTLAPSVDEALAASTAAVAAASALTNGGLAA